MFGLSSIKLLSHHSNICSQILKLVSSNISCDSGNVIVVKKLNNVLTIGINRPEVCNALNYETATQLLDAVDLLEKDDSVSVGVIHGIAGNFCSGLDLKEMKSAPNKTEKLRDLRLTERWVSKPLVAAISGHAVGFGLDLALWCDLRVMEDTAVLGCLQRRFGIPMSRVALDRLKSMVGVSRSLDWALTGRSVKVEEAYTSGLVARPVACGTSFGQAYSLATTIAKFPPCALLADRLALCQRTEQVDSQQLWKEAAEGAEKWGQGCGRHGKNTGLYPAESKLELGMDH